MMGCWQFFLLCFLSSPYILYRGSLEGYVLGGFFVVDEWCGSLIFLSFWLGALMMMVAKPRLSGLCVWGVVVCCYLAFSCWSFLWFYVFFELTLVPMTFMIVKWGSQPERVTAAFYMLLYTLGGSLPFLVFIIFCFLESGSFFMGFSMDIVSKMGIWGSFSMLVFFVKIPCYPFHLWLTKAHVEAPTAGSMALAGLLLKLGGYGLMRVLSSYGQLCYSMQIFWANVGIWGGVLSSVACLRQIDSKSLVAYSSVGHMSLVQLGILSGTNVGWVGALYMMVAHGLSSSGLFSVLGEYYAKVKSRSLVVYGGLEMIFPSSNLWWCLLVVCSMSCPPSLGFLGEVMMGMSVCGIYPEGYILCFILLFFFSGASMMVLYTSVMHGSFSSSLLPRFSGVMKCSYLGLFHGVPLVLLFFFPMFL
uniref:NADH-ubiquinone oxidoreductase chain 4 n=1 Tax=Amusium pleuronectes TaxID=158443 RepID=A0A7U0FWJ0_9BIVA|nr:NADH dehydrogenase subunit 4 [Amusium pleuronectes]QQV73594.1 NADH dehydrogenase subunit 4 [Amusium pleuronectes]